MAIPQLNQYDDLRKEVARRYEQLHPDLKAALVSVDTAGAVYEIGKKFGLNIEKTGYLADVIGYTIIGFLPVADFINNLKDALGIDGAKAEEIAREVNAKIFLAIREQLKKTHGEKWDERAMMPQETRDKGQGTRETTPTTTTTPQTPKSPWEIRPDGFQKTTPEIKSVIPPLLKPITDNLPQTTKAAEAELKKMQPPEPPKTREAPQPAPMTRDIEVLKEIKPSGIEARLEASIKKQEVENETTIQQTPAGLPTAPIRQEISIAKQEAKPEISSNEQVPMTETITKPQPPAMLPITEIRKQEAKPEISSKEQKAAPATNINIKEQVSRTETPKKQYEMDPYREPIA